MLKPISESDIPAIVVLMNKAFRGIGSSKGWNSEAKFISGNRTTEALIREDLASKPRGKFLKFTNDQGQELLGCVWLLPLGLDEWYLGSLCTDPDLQKAGLGSKLLTLSEQFVQQRGGKMIRMTVVNVREGLIAWYIKRGYSLTGETEPFPYDDNQFGTPLRDDLSFVVLQKML